MSEGDVAAAVDSAEQQGFRTDIVYDVAIVGAVPED